MSIFSRKDKSKVGRREPRFAGTWYEDNPEKLKAELTDYMQDAARVMAERAANFSESNDPISEAFGEKLDGKALYAIIVPHAGYIFSGSTAAFAYEQARHNQPERVFLMGPSHYVGFQGVALSPDSVFETPVGDLPLDRKTIDDLLQYPMFEESREVHRKEHSLELQLSFIRQSLGEVKLVPLVIGALPDVTDVRMVGQIVRRYLGEGDLVVVSSDFTHYGPRYDYVPFDCDVAAEKVKELDFEAFNCLKHTDLDAFIEFHNRTRCTICGFYPSAVLLSMLPSESQGNLLEYRTSRDTAYEDTKNSVSYMAVSFTGSDGGTGWTKDMSIEKNLLLNDEEKKDLLRLARVAVEKYVKERKIVNSKDAGIEITPALQRPLGVFVTLFKKRQMPRQSLDSTGQYVRDHNRDLRGCIGYIWPIKPLVEAVVDNAIGACSKDYRFIEVKESELEDLELEVSVLTPLTRVQSEKEIEIGKHGVVLYLKGRQSVFLPHVAVEFGWTLEETLTQLSLKAGLGAHDWKSGAKFDVFESIMFEEEHH